MDITYAGLDLRELGRVLRTGIDHAGAPITPFVDDDGDWPLRCCLTDSQAGERLAVVGFSPFPWTSAYRETGPVVVHADGCPGWSGVFPGQFERKDQVLRAFGDADGRTRTQVYDRNRLVRAGDGLEEAIEEIMGDERVQFVHAHNVLAQCWSFTAGRASEPAPALYAAPGA